MDRRDAGRGRGLWRVAAATGVLVVCVFAAAVVAALVGSWGRDLRRAAAVAAVLLAAAAFHLCRRGYRAGELLAALVAGELLFAGAIAWYAGAPRVDRFFLSWFLGGNLYLAAPWLAGAALGAWRAGRGPSRSRVR